MCHTIGTFISLVERPLIVYTLVGFFIYLKNAETVLEESKKVEGRSTEDINASGAQHLERTFFSAEFFLNGIDDFF